MNFSKIIETLRKTSSEDIIENYKKIVLILIGLLLVVFLMDGILKLFPKRVEETTVVEKEYLSRYEEETNASVYKPKELEEVTSQQKDDFSKYNLIYFEDVVIENDIAKIKLKNTSDKILTNIYVTLVDKDNEEALTLNVNKKTKLKPHSNLTLEGFTLQKDLKIGKYSFSLENEQVLIDLLGSYTSTSEHFESTTDYHDHKH